MLKKLLKALPFIMYLIRNTLLYTEKKHDGEKKDVQNPQ